MDKGLHVHSACGSCYHQQASEHFTHEHSGAISTCCQSSLLTVALESPPHWPRRSAHVQRAAPEVVTIADESPRPRLCLLLLRGHLLGEECRLRMQQSRWQDSTLLSPSAERTGQQHHSTLNVYVHRPKRTSYFHPCFLQKSSASACVWKFSVARPTLSRGSAVEVHPIKGFSHLHAMKSANLGNRRLRELTSAASRR